MKIVRNVVLAIMCLAALPAAAPAAQPLSLGVAMTPMSLLVFVAQEKGFFTKYGLSVTLKQYQVQTNQKTIHLLSLLPTHSVVFSLFF